MANETKRRAKSSTVKRPDLEWSVAATVAWFSALGRPVTAQEISKLLLINTASSDEVTHVLGKLRESLVEHTGYYSVRDCAVVYPNPELERWYRYKWWRARVAAGIIRQLPFVRLVAVANTLADRSAGRDSDIDLFIVIKHGRLFLGRTLVTIAMQVAGLRRHGRKIANRICLSFFATTQHRDFRSIALPPYDIYLAYWIRELRPVLDEADTFEDFGRANAWVNHLLPHRPGPVHTRRLSRMARASEWLLEHTLAVGLERRLARWQTGRISKRPKNPDPDVQIIAEPDMLKFHEKDRRRMYRERWQSLMRRLGYDPDLLQQ